MMKHLFRLAGWTLFEKGVEKAVDAKLGHLFKGSGSDGPGVRPKPKRNPPPPPMRPFGDPDDDDDDDDDDEWDEFDDDDDDEEED